MSFLSVASSLALTTTGLIAYKKAFKRYEKPDLDNSGFLSDFSLVKDSCQRELVKFPSKFATLQGYYYKCNNPKGLIVISHGLHSCADDFLMQTLYFLSNGYSVFSYDLTGTNLSEGSWTYGLVQFLIDLDYCLTFLDKYKPTKNLPKFLFGHSMGGYAALSVLNLHQNIKAVVSISAPNSGSTLIVEKGLQFVDESMLLGADLIEDIQNKLFGHYVSFNALEGINSVNCPILVVHSAFDMVIDCNSQSAYAYRKQFTNKKVKTYLDLDLSSGHTNILYSKKAISYQKEINKQIRLINKTNSKEETNVKTKEIYANIDRFKYSELNEKLMDKIINFFNKA